VSWETTYLARAKTAERCVYRLGGQLMSLGAFVQRWAVRETNRRETAMLQAMFSRSRTPQVPGDKSREDPLPTQSSEAKADG
jgi:hypothetical protein